VTGIVDGVVDGETATFLWAMYQRLLKRWQDYHRQNFGQLKMGRAGPAQWQNAHLPTRQVWEALHREYLEFANERIAMAGKKQQCIRQVHRVARAGNIAAKQTTGGKFRWKISFAMCQPLGMEPLWVLCLPNRKLILEGN